MKLRLRAMAGEARAGGWPRDVRRPPLGWLSLAFAGVGLAFVLATGFAEYHALSIDRKALDIAQNAAPSIEYLTAARVELRHMQTLAEECVDEAAKGVTPSLARLEEARARVGEAVRSYRALPAFAGEEELFAEVVKDLPSVDQALDLVKERAQAGDQQGAEAALRRELDRAVDVASEAISRSVEFDAAQSRRLALEIEKIRSASTVIAFVLDGVCILLAIVAGVLAVRAVRSYTRLVESHNRLMERRAAELEIFAGRVAHDILSPLGAVGLALDGARLCAGDEAKMKSFLSRGKATLAQVKLVVDGLLEFARSGAKPAPDARAGVRPVVESLLLELAPAAAKAEVQVRAEPFRDCAVAAAPGVLASLLGNLLQNALKYLGDGPVRLVTVRLSERGERVRFEVEDTGPGVPPEIEEKLFEPHVRAPGSRQPGIGLGLATVKRLAEAHGGAAGLCSPPGRGSLFWFELPRAASAPESPSPSAGSAESRGDAARPDG